MGRGERGRISADGDGGAGAFESSNHNSFDAFPQITFALKPSVAVRDRNGKYAWPSGGKNRTDTGVRLHCAPHILEHRGCQSRSTQCA